MSYIDRFHVAAWVCLLTGFSLVAWQVGAGGDSNRLFDLGVIAMIVGSVLRVYGKYWRSKPRAKTPTETPENPNSD